MAALVVVNSDCSKLSKAAIKKAIRNKLTTLTIYKFNKNKASFIDLLNNCEKLYNYDKKLNITKLKFYGYNF